MANVKEYAYYMEGSKVCIVEKDTGMGNRIDSRDYGAGSQRFQWRSPLSDITDGLELLYSYSPTYRITDNNVKINVNKFFVNGWIVKDGYLSFIRTTLAGEWDWGTVATAGTEGDTGGQSLDYILISNSDQWNGIHRIKSAGSNGILQTYTRADRQLLAFENVQLDSNTSEEIFDGGANTIYLGSQFSANDYIFTSGWSGSNANGMWQVASTIHSALATSNKIIVSGIRYVVPDHGELSAVYVTGMDQIYESPASLPNDTDESDIYLYKAVYDHCSLQTNINVLNDEADEIDLPNYLSKSLVHYVKAKFLEDQGMFKESEYFMAKFRKQVEKYQSRLISGPRMISSGPHAII